MRTFRLICIGKTLPMLLLFFLYIPARGQIVINEFSASNSITIADPDFDEYPDWIELYNSGSQLLNLKGYYLTDNFDLPEKWQITEDVMIQPGGFLLIWADGMNTGVHAGFRISADGEELALYNPGSILVDSVSFTHQDGDISYGRLPDGHDDWRYFQDPTPGSANITQSFTGIVFNLPSFSIRGGLYTDPRDVELFSDFGGDIRYTTDGSEPTGTSDLFSGSIHITETTVVRARIFKPGLIPGPVITQSYFINENSAGGKLPLVSVATDPGLFWDPESGIYTQDFKPLWEIPVNIELYENNGLDRAAFNQRAGMKINGLYSWQLPQKMLGVYFKKAYGPGNLEYRVTPQRNRNSYKSFALRASGSDWSYTLFRDVLAHHATLYNMDIDIMGFKPAVVFVNGEYLGIHNIREKVDADYIENSFSLEPGSFDLVENQEFPEAGDMMAFEHLRSLLDTDLSVNANYNAVAGLVDIENFTDMVITEMACRNTSINHNVMAWKPKAGGKWRWVLMDLDRGFFKAGERFIDFYLSQQQLILRDLFENQQYRDYFAKRLASHLFTTFNPERMKTLIDEHESIIENEIPRHIERWYGTTSDYGDAIPSESYWREEVCNVRSFVAERPALLMADLQNYDFPGFSYLSLASDPSAGGRILLNGLKTSGPLSYGPYLNDMEIAIEAFEKPGYEFKGWYELPQNWIIPEGSTWKYLDTGTEPQSSWLLPGFDDGSWSSGPAELGYGDGDEQTVISYGGESLHKFITTYFRRSFNVNEQQVREGIFFIHLLKDDGAIVYLNGVEIVRANLPCGDIDYLTKAETGIDREQEETFITYRIDNELLEAGSNLLAAEIHQISSGSSDVSFDLGLSYYLPDSASLFSSGQKITLTLTEDLFLSARYSENSSCIIPAIIQEDMTLTMDCSPYLVQEDITIPENITLSIEPGVEILMPGEGDIFIEGVLIANGTSEAPVIVRLNPEYTGESWGGMVFRNTIGPSVLNHVIIEDASEGPDPVLENAAISAFNANLELDHLVMEQVQSNPIVCRYSDIILTNSKLHSEVTGDLINVKYGNARIEDCRFTGNNQPDTDAIDYDEIGEGVIRNCIISGFYGFNSDAIDIGEEAVNILIDSIVAYNITDKGVSLGQQSSATVRSSVFINCNMGIAVKDSSSCSIHNCIFYSTGNPVACFEKNVGLAGGNARVKNSILSNSSGDTFMADGKSTIHIAYSLSDNLPLPAGYSNISGNPLFAAPSFFDFSLSPSSPGILSGSSAGEPVNMGTSVPADYFHPDVMITQIFINGSDLDLPQFIMLYNPSDEQTDLSGYAIDKGFTANFPQGTFIGPKGRIFLTGKSNHFFWDGVHSRVIEWSAGRLSGNGESIRLVDPYGIVTDYLEYEDSSWPSAGFEGENAFTLIDPALDNHFGENWKTDHIEDVLKSGDVQPADNMALYPNPTRGIIHIDHGVTKESYAELFDIHGRMVERIRISPSGQTVVDLSEYAAGIYLIKIGAWMDKVMIVN